MSENVSDKYLAMFEAAAAERSSEPAELAALRRDAMARFSELGFPTTREEDWRHTNLGPLSRASFTLADSHNSVSASQAAEFVYDECDRLVFVNGRLSSELSSVGELPEGTVVGSLRDLRGSGVSP